MKCKDGQLTTDAVGAVVESQVDREPPSDIFHGHTFAARYPGRPISRRLKRRRKLMRK